MAIVFDGTDDHIRVDNAGVINYERNNPFSVCCWVKLDPNYTDWGKIIDKKDSSSNEGWDFTILGEGGGRKLRITLIGDADHALSANSNPGLNLNQWYFVAVTYDGSSQGTGINMYIDGDNVGKTVDNDNLTIDISQDTIKADIGGWSDKPGAWLKGSIDNLMVFGKELSHQEVKNLMWRRGIVDPDLDFYLEMSERFNTLYDRVNNQSCTVTGCVVSDSAPIGLR